MDNWISVKDSLPIITDGNFAVSVIVATFDFTYAEINNGDGWEVYEASYGSIYKRDGTILDYFKGSDKENDFSTMYIGGKEGITWGPTGDKVYFWQYLPESPKGYPIE